MLPPVTDQFRILVRWDEFGGAVHVGAPVATEHRVFEVVLPELGDYIRQHEHSYSQVCITGVAVQREASNA